MNRVIHFELYADDPDRATEFYNELFGWIVSKKTAGNEDYWLIATGRGENRGINGGMKQRNSKRPGMIPTIEVSSVDDVLAKLSQSGGKVVEPKKEISGTGYLAYCEDPEGNLFAILQYDAAVK